MTNNYLRVFERVAGATYHRALIFFDDQDGVDTDRAMREAQGVRRTPRDQVVAFRGECGPGERWVRNHAVDGVIMVPLAVIAREAVVSVPRIT